MSDVEISDEQDALTRKRIDTFEEVELFCRRTDVLAEDEWLSAHSVGIGASDWAKIMGKDPFGSAFSVQVEKTTGHHTESNEAMECGMAFESAIIRLGAKKITAESWTFNNGRRVARKDELFHATLDGLYWSEEHGVEVAEAKNVSAYKKKDWDGGPPLHVQIQAQAHLYCTGLRSCVVVACFGGNALGDGPWRLSRSEEFMASAVPFLRQWWHKHVILQEPIEPDADPKNADLVKALYPKEETGLVVQLTERDEEFIRMRDSVAPQAAGLQKALDGFAAYLGAKMGKAETAVLPSGRKITWKTHKRAASKASEYRKFDYGQDGHE